MAPVEVSEGELPIGHQPPISATSTSFDLGDPVAGFPRPCALSSVCGDKNLPETAIIMGHPGPTFNSKAVYIAAIAAWTVVVALVILLCCSRNFSRCCARWQRNRRARRQKRKVLIGQSLDHRLGSTRVGADAYSNETFALAPTQQWPSSVRGDTVLNQDLSGNNNARVGSSHPVEQDQVCNNSWSAINGGISTSLRPPSPVALGHEFWTERERGETRTPPPKYERFETEGERSSSGQPLAADT